MPTGAPPVSPQSEQLSMQRSETFSIQPSERFSVRQFETSPVRQTEQPTAPSRESRVVSRSTVIDYVEGTDCVVGSNHDRLEQLITGEDGHDSVIVSVRGRPPIEITDEFISAGSLNSGEMDAILGSPHSIHVEPVLCIQQGVYVVTNISLAFAFRLGHEKELQNPAQIQSHLTAALSRSFWNWLSPVSAGQEVFRRLHYLGNSYIAIEQNVSYLPYRQPDEGAPTSWSAYILNDSSSIDHGLSNSQDIGFQVLSNTRDISIDSGFHGMEDADLAAHPDPCESRRRLRSVKGIRSRVDRTQGTPISFYLDLIATSRRSWNRALGFLEYRQEQDRLRAHKSEIQEDLQSIYVTEQLKLDKALAARAEDYSTRVLQNLRGPAKEMMHYTVYDTDVQHVLDRGYQYALLSMEQLNLRAKRLQTSAQEHLTTEMATINIRDAKRSIEAAERMETLTLLAFFFLPASFISSFFGMNMWPLTNDGPGLWIFFVVTVPLLGFIAAIFFRRRLKSFLRKIV